MCPWVIIHLLYHLEQIINRLVQEGFYLHVVDIMMPRQNVVCAKYCLLVGSNKVICDKRPYL